MFLTRLGFGSQIVVTGDITQIDLPGSQRSGLKIVREILEGVDGVHFATLDSQDVVRHKLVTDIVDAYDRWQAQQEQTQGSDKQTSAGKPGSAGDQSKHNGQRRGNG